MNIQGVVEQTGVANRNGKNVYSLKVNGQWYGGIWEVDPQAPAGTQVAFEANQNGNFWNIKKGSLSKTVGEAQQPTQQPSTQQAPAAPAAPVVNTRDISILYQSSRKDALALMPLMFEQGAIKFPAKVKEADKYDTILALVDEMAARFYLKAKEVVDNGGPSEDDVVPNPGA